MPFEEFEKPPIPPEEEREEVEEELSKGEEISEEKLDTEAFQRFKVESVPSDAREFSDYFSDYFEDYKQPEVAKFYWDNIRSLNEDGIFLYKTSDAETKQEKLNHIIWVYRESKEYCNRPISKEDWEKLREKPEIIEGINKSIIESLNQALDFYAWKMKPRGFLIEESKHFGMEVGNIHGIRINFQIIKPLLEAIQEGDTKEIEKQKKYIASSIVHELTHEERDNGLISTVKNEIASHITQFCFDPKENEIFNRELDQSLVEIEKTRKTQKPLDLYDKARYSALLLVAQKLGEKKESIHTVLEKDKDPSKVNALKQLRGFIEEKDIERMRKELVREFIEKDSDELWEMVVETEKNLGIKDKITERK